MQQLLRRRAHYTTRHQISRSWESCRAKRAVGQKSIITGGSTVDNWWISITISEELESLLNQPWRTTHGFKTVCCVGEKPVPGIAARTTRRRTKELTNFALDGPLRTLGSAVKWQKTGRNCGIARRPRRQQRGDEFLSSFKAISV